MAKEFADNLNARIGLQQYAEKFLAKKPNGEQWIFTMGDYSQRIRNGVSSIIPDHFPTRTVINSRKESVSLQGYEVFLHDMALNLLQTKTDPVVMLDLGGGAGATWNRLAIAMRDEIEQGRLAMVVSNLTAAQPEHHIQRFESIKNDYPLTFSDCDADQIREELKDADGLVHYVDGPFFALRMSHITLPNGQKLKLEGNIDFVNERFSLTRHGFTPDLDILIIGHLLSEYGIYIVPTLDTYDLEYKKFHLDDRREGISIAHRRLQEEFGLSPVTHIKRKEEDNDEQLRNHKIFRGPLAPEIILS